jgi:hypothetical protein
MFRGTQLRRTIIHAIQDEYESQRGAVVKIRRTDIQFEGEGKAWFGLNVISGGLVPEEGWDVGVLVSVVGIFG